MLFIKFNDLVYIILSISYETIFISCVSASELDADLPSLFPGQNGDLTSENFSPAWFLLEQHRATGFLDLKAGLQHLERKV